MVQMPDGSSKVVIQGNIRAKPSQIKEEKNFITALAEVVPPPPKIKLTAEDESIINRIKENIQVLIQYEHFPEELMLVVEETADPGVFADIIIANCRLEVPLAQKALEELDPLKRLRLADEVVTNELKKFVVGERIRALAIDELAKDQREYYLREQIKQIKKELGEDEDAFREELSELKKSLEKAKLPASAKKEAEKQLKRLERMHVETAEYSLIRTYLEWLSELPWAKRSRESLDLKEAYNILEEDHYGLEKVKERVLEFLSVRKLNKNSKGSILCFVGPPGVGKTSLGRSIARALNRKFFRMSVGGIRDEAEIRGHRRTYVGALPGRLIQGLKQIGVKNPVFMLDELDKVGTDFRGDPSSALLEALDPEQNKNFVDHYLGVPFDLSEVFFIATANTTDTIPSALLDRLEVIRISGYTREEKIAIAQKYLFPEAVKEVALEKEKIAIGKQVLGYIIDNYTREAGVRELKRKLKNLCRKLARLKAEGKLLPKRITIAFVRQSLGVEIYHKEAADLVDEVGVVNALAWTPYGGELMPIEVSTAEGKGELILTGQLGNVMQESAKAALFYCRANAEKLGIDPHFYRNVDIHIHAPGGAIPKDGPSAGVALTIALASALSQRPVSKQVAVTGEVTLRGKVLAVGGIKEKALAALRGEIFKVIIPYNNIRDLQEIPAEQRKKIKFIPVKNVDEALQITLKPPIPSSKTKKKERAKKTTKGIRKSSKEIVI
ncbi:MAG: endopeptidase La [Candidatus Dadabacteria bacterium]|nr:MAG: endopeptidase La [Candidatus Dadabacteria bacterium]